jgi:hypothetical protein
LKAIFSWQLSLSLRAEVEVAVLRHVMDQLARFVMRLESERRDMRMVRVAFVPGIGVGHE